MVFARAAVICNAVRKAQRPSIATEMLAGVDEYVIEILAHENSDEVLDWYENMSGSRESLSAIASRVIRLYEKHAAPLTQLAEVLARRLSVTSSIHPEEIASLFEEVADEAARLMRISIGLEKLNRP
jgi:hypothetical protein